MPSSFDAIDPGSDFESHYPDVVYVTVRSVDAYDATVVLAAAENVAAAKVVIRVQTVSARTGQVVHGTTDGWWIRSGPLEFEVKPNDQLVEAGGAVWLLDTVESMGRDPSTDRPALAKCAATRSRSH